MPDPNTEHGLRVQLATALRERDAEKARADAAEAALKHEQDLHFKAERAADKLITEKDGALAAARRECEELRKALGGSSSWPVPDVLDNLAGAVEHLMRDHGCDAHGWELADGNIARARVYAANLRPALAAPAAGEEGNR